MFDDQDSQDAQFQNDAASLLAAKQQREKLLNAQLQQALALSSRTPMQGYGALGGIGAGLANFGNAFFGGLRAKRLGEQLSQTGADEAATRAALLRGMDGSGASAPIGSAAGPAADQSLTASLLRGTPPSDSSSASAGIPPALARGPGGFAAGSSSGAFSTAVPQGIARNPALGNPFGIPTAQSPAAYQPPPASPQDASSSIRPGGGPPSGATQNLGTKTPSAVTSPDDPLADEAQRNFRSGSMLIASGDPYLAQVGESRVKLGQNEQQLDAEQRFQEQQAQLGREQQTNLAQLERQTQQQIAMKPQFHPTPFGLGGYVFDPVSKTVNYVPGGGPGAPGATDSDNPFPPGSKPWSDMNSLAEKIENGVDIARLPGNLQQDVKRLQLGQNLQGIINQAKTSGWNDKLRAIAASDLEQLVSGAQGSEGEVNALAQKSGAGTLDNILSGLTGNPTGPQLEKYTQFLSDFANREHGLAYNRLGNYIDASFGGGAANVLKSSAPRMYERSKAAALAKLSGLGDVSAGAQGVSGAGLPPTQPPGSFSIAGSSASGGSGGGGAPAGYHGDTVRQGGVTFKWNGKSYEPVG